MKRFLNFILNENDDSSEFDFEPFIEFACRELNLDRYDVDIEMVPEIEDHDTFGIHNSGTGEMKVAYDGRHPIDVMRTIAHELVHRKQGLTYDRDLDGSTGSNDENAANALAGVIMRNYAEKAFTE